MILTSITNILTAISAGIAIVGTVFGYIVKVSKSVKKIEEKLDSISDIQKTLNEHTETLAKNSQKLEEVKKWMDDQENIEIQNLKYMINNTYYSHGKIEEIPNEMLINACECCDIYLDDKKLNHEIPPRCKELRDERTRREREERDKLSK